MEAEKSVRRFDFCYYYILLVSFFFQTKCNVAVISPDPAHILWGQELCNIKVNGIYFLKQLPRAGTP